MDWASASIWAVTLLTPRCRTSPSCCSSASASNGSASDRSTGAEKPGSRRFTTSRTSTPRWSRLSCTAWRSSSADSASGHPPSGVRRAPTLVTIVSSVGIGVQGLADELVHHVRAVVVAGVDVVDAEFHRAAQHGDRGVPVGRRAHHAGPGELHGSVPEPVHRAVAEGVPAGLLRGRRHGSCLPRRCSECATRGRDRSPPTGGCASSAHPPLGPQRDPSQGLLPLRDLDRPGFGYWTARPSRCVVQRLRTAE